jgi:hypothetical protein
LDEVTSFNFSVRKLASSIRAPFGQRRKVVMHLLSLVNNPPNSAISLFFLFGILVLCRVVVRDIFPRNAHVEIF